MQTSEKVDAISAAVVKAQGETKHAIKDSTNPHFKAKYADLGSVWAAVKPALVKNELAALQDFSISEGGIGVKTRLIHSSGQWIEFDSVSIPVSKKDAQGVGSAITYARRYSLSAALGVVADEDDDGNAAVQAPAARVPDAQSKTAEVDKVKNAPGVSEAKVWVRNHVHDLAGSGNPDEFMEHLTAAKARWVRICAVYPNVWKGPEETGLRGEALKIAANYECRTAFDLFVKEVEAEASNYQQEAAQ